MARWGTARHSEGRSREEETARVQVGGADRGDLGGGRGGVKKGGGWVWGVF